MGHWGFRRCHGGHHWVTRSSRTLTVDSCGVEHVAAAVLDNLGLSVVEGTENEQAVGKVDVLLQYLAVLALSTTEQRR